MATWHAALAVVVLAVGGTPPKNMASSPNAAVTPDSGVPMDSPMPPLAGNTGWLNSAPLTAKDLQGKVVLIDFWTYTCINWRRTLPYLHAWVDKYAKSGLVLVGVHSPEFPFEHDVDNVRQMSAQIGVAYPIALDADFAVWRSFDNEFWPALYIFDAKGRLRHRQFGEGGYEETERIIQKLLAEAGQRDVDTRLSTVNGTGAEAAPDWKDLESPENYLGAARTEGFSSPGGIAGGQRHLYTAPKKLSRNHWGLSGTWTVDDRRARVEEAGGRILYRFHARDLHLVMGPATRGGAVRFRVLLDGKPPGPSHGVDVDEAGNGTAKDQRMYQLIRQGGAIGDRQFEIEFLDPGAEAWSFTFG